jgi:2-hydroxychromene-2-carboxylate isomerase
MKKTVEFFYDIASPYSYLAATQLGRLEKHATVVWRPFLIGGVFRASNNVMPAANPLKGHYMLEDLKRLAGFYREPFRFPSRFPLNSLLAMRCITARPVEQRPELSMQLFRAYWVNDADLNDPEVLEKLVGPNTVARASDDAVKAELKASTDDAARRGAFGAPTFFVGNDMYFGEDRIFLIEHALQNQG